MSKTKLHIGNIDDMGNRFVSAWERAIAPISTPFALTSSVGCPKK